MADLSPALRGWEADRRLRYIAESPQVRKAERTFQMMNVNQFFGTPHGSRECPTNLWFNLLRLDS